MPPISPFQDRFLATDFDVKYVKEQLKALLVRLNTCVPGVIQSYDVKKNRAVVLPTYKIKLRDEVPLPDGTVTNEVPIPPLSNVPVLFFGGANLRISFEPKKDDKGIIIFSQRSLDQWKAFLLQNAVPTQHAVAINRLFDMNDGMFLPSVLDKFEQAATEESAEGEGGVLDNLLGVATRLTGLDTVSQGLENVGSEIKSLTDRRNELQREGGDSESTRQQIASLNNQISEKTTENNSLLSQFRGERDQLTGALEDQIGGVVEDATSQLTSLFGEIPGLGGLLGAVGDKKTTEVLGGNKLNWKGVISAGNEKMTLLEAYEDLHAQVQELTNILLQLTVAMGSAISPPGVTGGPLLSLTEGLVSLSSSRISLQISKLIAKNMVNKLKLRRMLK